LGGDIYARLEDRSLFRSGHQTRFPSKVSLNTQYLVSVTNDNCSDGSYTILVLPSIGRSLDSVVRLHQHCNIEQIIHNTKDQDLKDFVWDLGKEGFVLQLISLAGLHANAVSWGVSSVDV
jgi:hypothetical protein